MLPTVFYPFTRIRNTRIFSKRSYGGLYVCTKITNYKNQRKFRKCTKCIHQLQRPTQLKKDINNREL